MTFKVTYQPYNEVVIKEIVRHSLDEFIQEYINTQGRIIWCNGVIFIMTGFPLTPDIVKAQIEGKVMWNQLEFAYMPKYTPSLEARPSGARHAVLNGSKNPIFPLVTKWLKEQEAYTPSEEELKEESQHIIP